MAVVEHKTDRYLALDGLRAVSILLVLGCHLLPLGPKALGLNGVAGAMGMSLFFALSGFLITSNLIKNPDVFDFLTRRFARILPLAYVYTFVVFTFIAFDPSDMLWADTFTINYATTHIFAGLSGHLWSLCVEVQFYVAVALAVALAGRRGLWLVWPACLLVTLLRLRYSEYSAIQTHLRVDEILVGACVAMAMGTLPVLQSARRIRLIMATAVIVWAVASHGGAGAFQCLRPYATAVLLFSAMQYGRVRPETQLCSRPLRYIAGISYALYVIHPAAAFGWMDEGSVMTRYLLKRPITFAITFGLAHLSTFHLERNVQNYAKKWLRKRREGKFIVQAPAYDFRESS